MIVIRKGASHARLYNENIPGKGNSTCCHVGKTWLNKNNSIKMIKLNLRARRRQCISSMKPKFKQKVNNAIPKRTLIIYFLYSFLQMIHDRIQLNPLNTELKICETEIR